MSDNVKPLFGGQVLSNKPVQEVIEECERLLQMARDGQIIAVAYATVTRDNSVQTMWRAGVNGTSLTLSAGISQLQYRINKALQEGTQ